MIGLTRLIRRPEFTLAAMSTCIRLEHIVLPGIVTLGSGAQLVYFASKVWSARERFGVQFPATIGNVDFERISRAHQNTLEFYPIYMSALWTSSLFFHQVPAAICGVVYIYSRHKYFQGYSRSVEERLPGFFLGMRTLKALMGMAMVGLVGTLLQMAHDHSFYRFFVPHPSHSYYFVFRCH